MFAPIITKEDISPKGFFKGDPFTFPRVGVVSGGFDPIHPGHISNIIDAKNHCIVLVVVVNGDDFLINKKGKQFMDHETRCNIVSGIKGVDYVYKFIPTDPKDSSVVEALDIIKPDCFCKGGDRNSENIPEFDICQTHGIEIINNVGEDKLWASSDYLRDWVSFRFKQIHNAYV